MQYGYQHPGALGQSYVFNQQQPNQGYMPSGYNKFQGYQQQQPQQQQGGFNYYNGKPNMHSVKPQMQHPNSADDSNPLRQSWAQGPPRTSYPNHWQPNLIQLPNGYKVTQSFANQKPPMPNQGGFYGGYPGYPQPQQQPQFQQPQPQHQYPPQQHQQQQQHQQHQQQQHPRPQTQMGHQSHLHASPQVNLQQRFQPQQQQQTQSSFNPQLASNQSDDALWNSYAPLADKPDFLFSDYDPAQHSNYPIGSMKAFAGNTYKGIYRKYNEDRVMMAVNLLNNAKGVAPGGAARWPLTSFFGIFDGHHGDACAEFMKNNMHSFITRDEKFPTDIMAAISNGIRSAEQCFFSKFCANAEPGKEPDWSGTCACLALIVDDVCYVANVGDCRGVLSSHHGKTTKQVSKDHRPSDREEYARIVKAGGHVAQLSHGQGQAKMGPYRVFPGSLTISRALGDIEAKDPRHGGNPNVVISAPEVMSFPIGPEHDFLFIASDGIYDVFPNEEIPKLIFEFAEKNKELNPSVLCSKLVDHVMKLSMHRNTHDNISVVLVLFENFIRKLKGEPSGLIQPPQQNLMMVPPPSQPTNLYQSGCPSPNYDLAKPAYETPVKIADPNSQEAQSAVKASSPENQDTSKGQSPSDRTMSPIKLGVLPAKSVIPMPQPNPMVSSKTPIAATVRTTSSFEMPSSSLAGRFNAFSPINGIQAAKAPASSSPKRPFSVDMLLNR